MRKQNTSTRRSKLAVEMLQRIGGNQPEIARQLGCSQAHLSNITLGKREPSIEMLEAIAELAGGEICVEFRAKKKNLKK